MPSKVGVLCVLRHSREDPGEAVAVASGRGRWFGSALFGILIGTVVALGLHLPGWWRAAGNSAASASHAGDSTNAAAGQWLTDLIDAERVRAGCSTLHSDPVLRTVAQNRAQSITSPESIGHVDSDLR